MRRVSIQSILLLCAIVLAHDAITQQGTPLDVMTYNIKVAYGDPGPNKWENRKDAVADLITYYAPDILGVQEALQKQLVDITAGINGYAYTGVGRDDGNSQGEYCAIFYDTSRFNLVRSNTFWLSETPSQPSKGWDANYFRICSYALLRENSSGKSFWVFNTHWDHQSALARKMSAQLIVDSIAALHREIQAPVILVGDLNAEIDSAPLRTISEHLTDTRRICQTKPYGPHGTYTGFDTSRVARRCIDFIFTTPGTAVSTRYRVIDDRMGLAYPSDHFPVLVTLLVR
jgi:endonuclease/exonuclease/phosphatase family metal-dependent hydrolase